MKSVAPVEEPEHQVATFSLEDVVKRREILARRDAGLVASGRRRATDLADPVDFFLGTDAVPASFATVAALIGSVLLVSGLLAALRMLPTRRPRLSPWSVALMAAGNICCSGVVV